VCGKVFDRTQEGSGGGEGGPSPLETGDAVADEPLHRWLTHSLHHEFHAVVVEPLPMELLRLLECLNWPPSLALHGGQAAGQFSTLIEHPQRGL
jgi:hypothetical protein